MEMLFSLWLPILVCTVALYLLSFVFWVVLPHHKPDVRKWPDEDALLHFVRGGGAAPGQYMFPLIEQEDCKKPEAIERYQQGPWGMVVLWPTQPNMAMNMVKTILLFLIITTLVGYVGALTLAPGTAFGSVFQVIGLTAVLAHTTGGMLNEVWFTKPLRARLMNLLDGIVYGVVTGLIFAWLWP